MKLVLRFLPVYLLLGAAIFFVYRHQDVEVPINRPLAGISRQAGDWRLVEENEMEEKVLKKLKPTDYLYRTYQNQAGRRVTLYIGYHGGGPDSGPIHSPKHCLPGAGWQLLKQKKCRLSSAPGRTFDAVEALYGKDALKVLFIYWFQVKGNILTNEYALKFAEIKNSLLYNRRDSAFIRISVSAHDDIDGARQAARSFIRVFFPEITSLLPGD